MTRRLFAMGGLRKTAPYVICLPMVIMLLALIAILWLTHETEYAEVLAEHLDEVVQTRANLQGQLAADTRVRGCAATRSRESLPRYQAAGSAIPSLLDDLPTGGPLQGPRVYSVSHVPVGSSRALPSTMRART